MEKKTVWVEDWDLEQPVNDKRMKKNLGQDLKSRKRGSCEFFSMGDASSLRRFAVPLLGGRRFVVAQITAPRRWSLTGVVLRLEVRN